MTDIKKYNLLIVMLIISSGLVAGVGGYIRYGGSAGWLLCVVCTLIAAVVYPRLFRPAAMMAFGRYSGGFKKLVCVATALVAVCYTASLSAYFANNITTVFLNKTPRWYILTLLIAPSAVGCWFGTKSVSRYGGIVAFFTMAVVAAVLAMCSREYSANNLYPILGGGVVGMAKGLINITEFAGIVFYYILLCNCSCAKAKVGANVTKIILTSGATVCALCLGLNLLLPYPAARMTAMPLYTLAASVRGNYIIERSESVVLLLWLFAAYVSISGTTAVTSLLCARSFSLDNRNALTAAFGAVVFALAYIICKNDAVEVPYRLCQTALGVLSVAMPIAINIWHRCRR